MAKVHVGLLGSARALQRDLERITKAADTNSVKGLNHVLHGLNPRSLPLSVYDTCHYQARYGMVNLTGADTPQTAADHTHALQRRC